MIDELARNLRAIHDLERVIRIWEVVRDNAQEVVNESIGNREERGDFVEITPRVTRAFACIVICNTSILAIKARIDELERED
jgi:hypothetical protein